MNFLLTIPLFILSIASFFGFVYCIGYLVTQRRFQKKQQQEQFRTQNEFAKFY